MSHPEDSISPVTSPFVSDNELEVAKPKEARTPKKQTPSKHSSSPLQMRSTPIRPKWHASMMKFSPSASRNPAPTPAGASANDSDDDDDDLEILPPKQSRAVRQLVNLSGLGSLSKAEIDKRRNNQKLAVDVMEKQREQILRDRHEKEEMIKKIRGEVLAEMKNSKKGDAEDEEFEREHLFEIARREAELIRKREIEAEKKKVEAVEIPSEDEEIQIDFDEEEQEDPEDDELVVPFDQEDEESSEDEPENDKEETLIPEATVQDVKSHRRRPQILDDDEDDNNDNPFASQATQSNPDISMTQMFQQTQTALSNSQQLKIGDFSSDEDDEEVIPATQLESSTTNANNDADGSLQDESFEFRSQKKVNFDFDTDVLPTQLSQFPEPTQVNMVQRPDMMDIVEGLRRPNDTKPGLRRKNRLDEKDTLDGAATQADLGSSMTQAIPDSTEPIGLNDTTQKIFGTAPDATQKVLGTATDTQAIPFFETQVAPEPFGQLGTANPTAKEDDSADEDEEQRIYIRRHRQPKVTKGAKPKDTGAGRELADEEAVESEDEWAGMGGNSDDEMDPEIAEELKQMVDDDESSINQTKDAAALQKLFATKKRSEDQEMEGRLHDVITGDWRKKKTKGGLLDLSDDEDFVVGENDDIETQKYKRRLKKAMERRKRKLLENDKLAAMKNDPKKQSFMKIIEGENSFMDTKRYFADADSSDDELEIIETPSTEGTQEESSKAASVEPSMAMPPPALPKRAGSVTTATAGQPPAKKRRSEVEYIRQTLSFLDEDKSDGFENQDSEVPGGGWDPSRTLGDAIDPEQLISDDEDDDAMFMQEEAPLGEPSAAQHRSTRVVNLIQERRSLTISSMTSSSSTSAIEILDDNEQISATAAGDDDNDDDDDDEVIFKCTKFQSSATSIRRARHQENSKGFSDVVVGSMLAGVGSKSSINYKKRRLGGGAGPGSEAAAAQNRVTRMRFEAVDKVIASRKQSSVLLSRKSGGSWMEE
ncbi:hypothetical protein DV451_001275 [Geotrichum candidum]|uniref:DNA replication checkpoint mediator MRC1 domain-containing protein n=1 Tax=Geotrichum candidum TaxID=1173061 RepID=A0A9P5G704_GEOCN|nr:hypothetical protein DV451_001275 [Geotrichum candidum]